MGPNKPLRLHLLCVARLASERSHSLGVQIHIAYHNVRRGWYRIQVYSVAVATAAGSEDPWWLRMEVEDGVNIRYANRALGVGCRKSRRCTVGLHSGRETRRGSVFIQVLWPLKIDRQPEITGKVTMVASKNNACVLARKLAIIFQHAMLGICLLDDGSDS